MHSVDVRSRLYINARPRCYGRHAGALQGLRILDLSHNSLSGPLRASWAGLPSLSLLDVSYNNFTGTVPGSLFRAPLLETALLHVNSLTGSLPASQGAGTHIMLRTGLEELQSPEASCSYLKACLLHPTGPACLEPQVHVCLQACSQLLCQSSNVTTAFITFKNSLPNPAMPLVRSGHDVRACDRETCQTSDRLDYPCPKDHFNPTSDNLVCVLQPGTRPTWHTSGWRQTSSREASPARCARSAPWCPSTFQPTCSQVRLKQLTTAESVIQGI